MQTLHAAPCTTSRIEEVGLMEALLSFHSTLLPDRSALAVQQHLNVQADFHEASSTDYITLQRDKNNWKCVERSFAQKKENVTDKSSQTGGASSVETAVLVLF